MSDVFISYKRENLAAVNRLVEALRAEGVSVWWDQDIPPNAPWEATIEGELAAAKLVIVAWSPAAVASDNVKAEARWARGQGRLLQVFVEACEPPLFFGERQGVDLKGWSGDAADPVFRTLLQAVRAGPTPAPQEAASEALAAPLPLPSKPSIAVMPFANLSADPEQDYFADGMVEEITAALTRIRAIDVIASTSTLSFKGNQVTAQKAAQALGVRYVLEGSVRKAGGRVRITVKLMDAAGGTQIWADRFEDTLQDVFALQDQVALSVAGRIEPTVQQAEVRRVSARPTDSLDAYDLYLRAWPRYYAFSREAILDAIGLLRRAIALDPNFGAALMLAAVCIHMTHMFWADDPAASAREGAELAHRAVKAAGEDATVLAWSAVVLAYFEEDIPASIGLIERAIDLNPGSALVWLASGAVRTISAEPEIAFDHLAASARLDPMGPYHALRNAYFGLARFEQGRFEEALPRFVSFAQEADHPGTWTLLATTYGHLGRFSEGREALARFRTLTARSPESYLRTITAQPAALARFVEGITRLDEAPASAIGTSG
jgi:adenylate cyclase